ncbi:MAG: hypothetical protein AAFP76_08585 [Bacteroidota bacterium]
MILAFLNEVSFRKKFLSVLVFLLITSFSFSQNCSAELTVEKDRNARSADQDGTEFWMTLSNTSSSTHSYSISTINLKESCASKNRMSDSPNVNLNVSVVVDKATSNSISLRSGETKKFKVAVSVPKGTASNSWSCIEVQAQAEQCSAVVATALLKVYVPGSLDE